MKKKSVKRIKRTAEETSDHQKPVKRIVVKLPKPQKIPKSMSFELVGEPPVVHTWKSLKEMSEKDWKVYNTDVAERAKLGPEDSTAKKYAERMGHKVGKSSPSSYIKVWSQSQHGGLPTSEEEHIPYS